MNYYAYASRRVIDDSKCFKEGVEFEVVRKSDLDEHIKAYFKNKQSAIDNFKKNQLINIEIMYISAYMGSARANAFAETFWFELEVLEKNSADEDSYECCMEPANPEDETEQWAYCVIDEISSEYEEALNDLFRTPIAEKGAEINNVGAIAPGTVFNSIRAYYVGAALCVGLADNNNVIQGFFDIGYASSRAIAQLLFRAGSENLDDILAQLRGINPLTIIISHWHRDHINIALALLAADIGRHHWIYPVSASPVAGRLTAHVPPAQQTPMNDDFINAPMPINLGNITITKIDAFDTSPPAPGQQPHPQSHFHPHHHGIYAAIRLVSGNYAILSGDCTYFGMELFYSGMDFMQRLPIPGAIVLQASHHGGEHGLPPVIANDRLVSIPQFAVPHPPTVMNIFYSANGRTHGHPNQQIIAEYNNVGWAAGVNSLHNFVINNANPFVQPIPQAARILSYI